MKAFNIFLVSCLVSVTLWGQDDTENLVESDTAIFSMSIEELLSLDYEVESATKTKTTVQKAPSVVRLFTKEDFQQFGFTTIQDVLNSVPGMQIQEYRAGHQLVWIRGVQARYNNKVLLLVDGIPMRDSYYGNFNIDEMFPLEAIDKIEVLNGPGSVLYGANSFSGVINITTKKKGKSVGADYGTLNTYSVQGEYDINNFYANANYYHTDGFQPEYMTDGKSRAVNQTSTGQFGLLKYNNEKFSAMAGIAKYGQPYKYRDTKKEYYFDRMPIFGNLKYKHDFSDSSSLSVNAYANYFQFNRGKQKYKSSDSNELKEQSENPLNTMLLGGDIDYNLNIKKHGMIVGLSWQQDRALDIYEDITYSLDPEDLGREEVISDPNISRDNIGLFIQDVYAITDEINLTAGLRYDILSDFDNQFNYRAGVTGQWENGLYGKVLYGTAYRVPSYREYVTLDAPNASLEPEYLKTFEAQIGYLINKKIDINLTLYNNIYDNFIQEIVVDSITESNGEFIEIDDEMAFNWKSRKISGLELNSSIRSINNLVLNVGASYILRAKETAGTLDEGIYTSQTVVATEAEIPFLSKFNTYVNANYTIKENYSLGTNLSYFSKRSVTDDYQSDSDVQNVDNANGFIKLDAHTQAKFFKKKLTLMFKVNNVLNSKIYSPPYGGSDQYDVEWMGRNYRLSATFIF
ncbi:MAG: TonB-dependent receptor [Cytophagales bacterium]|nr:TonB-dependent receptor [Cytophagales bacterium]